MIEGPLDSEAEIISGLGNFIIIAEGMDKGDGSIDVFTDSWLPNHQHIWDKFIIGSLSIAHNAP